MTRLVPWVLKSAKISGDHFVGHILGERHPELDKPTLSVLPSQSL